MEETCAKNRSCPKRCRKAERVQKKFPEIVRDLLDKREPGDDRPLMLLAQDEGRFGRINDVRRAWAPAGVRPKAPRQIIRKYVYAYAAVCPSSGAMTSLVLPWANSQMMSIFLEHVSESYPRHFILMLVDGAGWHISKKVKVPENIRLIKQPSHSPELNPVEHIWEEIREKHFHNKAMHSLDDVEANLCRGLVKLMHDPDRVRSMTGFPYLKNTTH